MPLEEIGRLRIAVNDLLQRVARLESMIDVEQTSEVEPEPPVEPTASSE